MLDIILCFITYLFSNHIDRSAKPNSPKARQRSNSCDGNSGWRVKRFLLMVTKRNVLKTCIGLETLHRMGQNLDARKILCASQGNITIFIDKARQTSLRTNRKIKNRITKSHRNYLRRTNKVQSTDPLLIEHPLGAKPILKVE